MTTTAEIKGQIKERFDEFDHFNNGTCDQREISVIIRSLGINPTERQLKQMIGDLEEEEPTGFIRYEKFEQLVLRIVKESEYPRDSEERIITAFQTLDPEGEGFIRKDELAAILSSQGEAFTQEEIDDFVDQAADPEKGVIYYEDYAAILAEGVPSWQ